MILSFIFTPTFVRGRISSKSPVNSIYFILCAVVDIYVDVLVSFCWITNYFKMEWPGNSHLFYHTLLWLRKVSHILAGFSHGPKRLQSRVTAKAVISVKGSTDLAGLEAGKNHSFRLSHCHWQDSFPLTPQFSWHIALSKGHHSVEAGFSQARESKRRRARKKPVLLSKLWAFRCSLSIRSKSLDPALCRSTWILYSPRILRRWRSLTAFIETDCHKRPQIDT